MLHQKERGGGWGVKGGGKIDAETKQRSKEREVLDPL